MSQFESFIPMYCCSICRVLNYSLKVDRLDAAMRYIHNPLDQLNTGLAGRSLCSAVLQLIRITRLRPSVSVPWIDPDRIVSSDRRYGTRRLDSSSIIRNFIWVILIIRLETREHNWSCNIALWFLINPQFWLLLLVRWRSWRLGP